VADERARAQEGGLVALAFFFREAHHLEGEGQAPALPRELAHAGHRHEDAQAPVVLAAVAHGVVVRAGEQGARAGLRGLVAADHVAHGVDVHRVEAHVAHQRADLRGAGAVRVGQVGDGELALLGIARVGVHRELFLPVPHVVAERDVGANLSSRRISAMRWMLRSASPSSKAGWLCSRRAKVSMISRLLRPVPRGPRTARMNGKPNFAL
jgi:hypothetical protein